MRLRSKCIFLLGKSNRYNIIYLKAGLPPFNCFFIFVKNQPGMFGVGLFPASLFCLIDPCVCAGLPFLMNAAMWDAEHQEHNSLENLFWLSGGLFLSSKCLDKPVAMYTHIVLLEFWYQAHLISRSLWEKLAPLFSRPSQCLNTVYLSIYLVLFFFESAFCSFGETDGCPCFDRLMSMYSLWSGVLFNRTMLQPLLPHVLC